MSNHTRAQREKEEVWARIRRTVGPTHQPNPRRRDWLVTIDGSTSIFITFSSEDHLFYDVNAQDIRDWSGSYEHAFVVLVLGSRVNVLTVPLKTLKKAIRDHNLQPKGNGDYKLHVTIGPRGEYVLREASEIDLSRFHNNYGMLADLST